MSPFSMKWVGVGVLAGMAGTAACAVTEEGRLLDRGDALYRKGDLDGALERYRQVIALDPDNARAWYSASVVHYSRGDYRGALDELDRAVALDERAAWVLQRGHARVRLRDFEGAVRDYRRAVRLDPSLTEAYYAIGIALYNAHQYDRARDWLERYLELEPNADNAERVRELILTLREWS